MTSLRPAAVRVPCSTSNLGSGFDAIGLALSRYLEASFEPGGDGLRLLREGTLAGMDGPVDHDLLATSFRDSLRAHSPTDEDRSGDPAGTLRATSGIPVARGLGSSAAARVAGHALARVALGLPPDPEGAFRFATEGEGHGDNAAPCALGGLRVVAPTASGPRPLLHPLSEEVGFAYAAPARGVSTAEARAALPTEVAHASAVRGLGRLAGLLRGLADADAALVRAGVEDELHVPYRLPLVPLGVEARRAGYEAGAWGVTISGAGSGLIAICAPEAAAAVSEAMRTVFEGAGEEGGGGAVGFALEPDLEGLVLWNRTT